MINEPKHIVISRTDSIGDVVLTLPLCGILKSKYPDCKISFLGKSYTKDVIECSIFVDQFLNWDDLSKLENQEAIKTIKGLDIDAIIHIFPNKIIGKLFKKAGVKSRIGTSHRFHHFMTCNFRPNFTRKKSELHESQLNVKLLQPFGIDASYQLDELARYAGFDRLPSFPIDKIPNWDPTVTNVILHPKSQGSAVEWGMKNYVELITSNESNSHIHFYITGTEKESVDIRPQLPNTSNFTDLTGSLTLKELIGFIAKNKILIACSTGPLHIAGISNIAAIGLFSPRKPIHPGRWKPLGTKSKTIVYDKSCKDCQDGKECNCIQKINATRINQIAFHSK
jgi:ADP-heptose:LPS heptosyltransferase